MENTNTIDTLKAQIAALTQKLAIAEQGSLLPNNKIEWNSAEQALNYDTAFATMTALRRCKGTEVVDASKRQYIIFINRYGDIHIDDEANPSLRHSIISPCFSSEEAAKAAITKVGKQKIVAMFNTLHGLN